MGLILLATTLIAVLIIGFGLTKLRAARASGAAGGQLSPPAVLLFGGVAAAAAGAAFVPFAVADRLPDAVTIAIASVQGVLILGTLAVGHLLNSRTEAAA